MRHIGVLAALLTASGAAHAAFPPAVIDQGRYLAIAADCTACHTAPGKAAFAGGLALDSPLGAIVATNITPSWRHGIGSYSEAQFAAALRQGIRADGAHLYPAMPYTAYALLSDRDVHALYAYFMAGVAPVEQAVPATKLSFPFNQRVAMAGWNALFLSGARFIADPAHDARWNRGAYLVQVLGHCSACHSPRRLLMQESRTRALGGAPLGAWYAPNITSDPVSGIGAWRTAELIEYLRTGVAAGRARAAGGMAEVVEHSLSKLTLGDLSAIAAYLKTVPAVPDDVAHRTAGEADTPPIEPALRGTGADANSGASLYSGLCASCHGEAGTGTSDLAYPALEDDQSVTGPRPDNLIAVILNGVDRTVGGRHVAMPDFGPASYVQPLGDAQVAALASFVRTSFGQGGRVTAADVATARAGGPRSILPRLAVAAVLALLIIGIALARWRLGPRSG